MFTSIITIASSTPTDILAYAGTLFTDLSLLIVLAIGLPIGFWIITKAIGLVKGRAK